MFPDVTQQYRANSIISGRNPPLKCTFTLLVTQGHGNKNDIHYVGRFPLKTVSILNILLVQ